VECYNNLNKLSTAGDVWAWATTVYEIFTYGEPLPEMNYNQAVMVSLLKLFGHFSVSVTSFDYFKTPEMPKK